MNAARTALPLPHLIARAKRALLPFALATAALAASPAGAAPAPDKASVVRGAIEGYIRPAYADLAADAARIAADQAALCAVPSADALAKARADFAVLIGNFSRIEFVRFGPIMDESRIDRILFWPDRRGVALRQVQALLAEKDPAAVEPAALRAKSVALQGLNALEFVLFGAGSEKLATAEGAYPCAFGAAITANLADETAAISAGWQAPAGISGAMLEPRPDSPAYRSLDDSLQEIAGIFIHGLEATRDLRLNPALGESIEKANPKTLIYPRAGLAKASLHANVAGLEALYDASRIAGLLPAKQSAVGAEISAEFEKADGLFAELVVSLPDAVGNPAERPRVEEILALTHSLQRRFAEQLAPALGLSAGFSSLDGD